MLILCELYPLQRVLLISQSRTAIQHTMKWSGEKKNLANPGLRRESAAVRLSALLVRFLRGHGSLLIVNVVCC
jgi:hypothetical protein